MEFTTKKVREQFIGSRYDTMGVLREESVKDFDRWLNAQLADAWEEGYGDGRFNSDPLIKNPYRKAER